jgi:hypothetical protein
VGEVDAKRLAEGFSSFASSDLLNLGTGEALVRFEQARHDFNLRTFSSPEHCPDARARRDRVVARSREHYATRREEVEKLLADSLGQRPEQPVSRKDTQKVPSKIEPREVQEEEPKSFAPVRPVEPPPLPAIRTLPKTTVMGKGGQEHRYLQQLIKRWAEGLGYRSTIEKQLENGGSVDVLLEKDGASIACEISVTTTPEHELQNIRKCLEAGITQVFAIGSDARKLERVRKAVLESLAETDQSKVSFCDPAELLQFLQDREAKDASHETVVRGYRVNVNYQALPTSEQRDRRGAISRVVLQALKRKGRDI